ncbi:MAG: hypothetical protein H6Q70_522 [Firmicutes bacterium]|nr:hypothetical protein [Bacillota bacterium]
MAYLKGTATSFDDLITQIIAWCADSTIHNDDVWELIRNEPYPNGTILKAHGWEDGEHFYIGLMPKSFIKGETYQKWFYQDSILTSEFIYSKSGLGLQPDQVKISISDNIIKTITKDKYGNDVINNYKFSDPDVLNKSSQAMFLGVFKQYSSGLEWHEQAGGQRPYIPTQAINYINIANPQSTLSMVPPLMPGIGFPAIGMNIDGPEAGYINFWLTKDRQRLTIVTYNSGYWDVAHLGFLDPYHIPTEYAFPAVAIGGTSGAVVTGSTTYSSSGAPITNVGFKFEYSLGNTCLSHGVPTFSATPWNGDDTWNDSIGLSQAQLMLPDGTWQSFANYAVQKEIISVYSGGQYPSYYYAHKEPEQPIGLRHYLRPTYTNCGEVKHIYDVAGGEIYQLEPIEFVQGKDNSVNMFGKLKNIYWMSSPVYRYGEVTVNSKLYLVVPNGWEGRKWHIAHGRTGIVDENTLLEQDKKITEISNTMNCVIKLED